METQLRCFQRLASEHASERFVKWKRCGFWGYQRGLFFCDGSVLVVWSKNGAKRQPMELSCQINSAQTILRHPKTAHTPLQFCVARTIMALSQIRSHASRWGFECTTKCIHQTVNGDFHIFRFICLAKTSKTVSFGDNLFPALALHLTTISLAGLCPGGFSEALFLLWQWLLGT